MAESSTSNRNTYTGNGATSVYNYTFRIRSSSDLYVVKRDTSNIETVLVLNTDYTVTGVNSTSGGTITLSAGNLPTGYALSIRRKRPLTQLTDIRNQGDFYPEAHEDAFDNSCWVDQQQQNELDRAIKQAETDTIVDLTLPVVATRASQFLAFDASGKPIASPGPSSVAVSSFMAPVVAAISAAAARVLLGFTTGIKFIVNGDLADGIFSADANGLAKMADGFLAATTAARAKMADLFLTSLKLDGTTISSSLEMLNLTLAATVGSNALTIALKDKSGADPTAASPVILGFRNATAASGPYNRRSVTAALSTVISSGSTAGHSNALNGWIYVYAIDNAGTVELAWAGQPIVDDGSLVTTTAEGGAGAADSATTLYSTTARSNVPARLIGRLKSNQTTAGTWAAVPTEISLAPFRENNAPARSEVYLTGNSGFGAVNTKIQRFTTIVKNIGTAISITQNANNGDSFTINEDGLYWGGYVNSRSTTATAYHGFSVNSTTLTTTITSEPAATRLVYVRASLDIDAQASFLTFLRAGDVVRCHSDGTEDNLCQVRIIKVSH